MADIMITVDGNLTPIQQKIKSFETYLAQVQARATAAGSANVAIPKLDKGILSKLANPTLPPGLDASSKQGRAYAIKQQSELVALKLKELDISRRQAGLPGLTFEKGSVGQQERLKLLQASRDSLKGIGVDSSLDSLRTSSMRAYTAQSAEIERLVREQGLSLSKAFAQVSTPIAAGYNVGPTTQTTFGKATKVNEGQAALVAKLEAQSQAAIVAANEAEILAAQERINKARADAAAAAAAGRARTGLAGQYSSQVEAQLALDSELAAFEARRQTALKQILASQREQEIIAAEAAITGRRRISSGQGAGPFSGYADDAKRLQALDRVAPDRTLTSTRGASRELDNDELRSAYGAAAASLRKYAQIVLEDGARFGVGTDEFIGAMALVAAQAETTMLQFRGQVAQTLATSPGLLGQAAAGKAASSSGAAVLSTATVAARIEDPILAAQYQAAKAQGIILTTQENAAIQAAIAGDTASVEATLLLNNAKRRQTVAVLEATLADEKSTALIQKEGLLRAQQRALSNPTSQQNGPRGFFARIRGAETNASDLLGQGAISTLKYAIPSAVLFGAFAGITDAVKDSEELAVVFTKLESQLNAMGEGDNISAITDDIIQLSKESGIAASDLGNVAIQLQGAFGNLKFNANDPTKSLGGLKGSDDIIRYGQEAVKAQLDAAAKLSVVTGIAQDELVDGLTAASFAFGASADRIGDVAVRLEANTGVLAKETISFLGDIGPSAREAGFSLEEVAALAAVVQQKSGQSGSAIAEQLTRVFAALGGNAQKFFDLARSNKDAFGSQYEEFIKSVQGGDSKKTFNILANNFSELSKSSRDYVVELLGGQRQANTLLAAFGDSEGLSKAQEAAKNGAEGLDERYAKLQERISQIFKRLKAGFNELVKAIIDSGVGDAVAGIAGGFEKVFNILGAILSPIGQLNQLLGGTISKVVGLGLQFLAIKLAIEQIAKLNIATNIAGALGGSRAAFASGGIGAVASGLFSGTRAAYRNSLQQQVGSQFALNQVLSGNRARVPLPEGVAGPVIGATSKELGAMAGASRLKAAGAGLKTALGGSVGVGLLGVTGAFAAYDFISSAIDEDKAKIVALKANLANSKKTADQLISEAREMRVTRSGWYNFWHFLFDQPSPDDVKEVAGIVKKYKKGINAAVQANAIDPKAINKLILGNDQNTKSNLFERSGRTAVDLAKGVSSTVTSSGGEQIDVGVSEQDTNDLERLRDIYKRLGLANELVNAQVGKILLSTEDKVAGLKQLIDNDKTSPEVADQAARILAAITKTGILDPNTAQIFADISDPTKKLLNSSNETLLTNIESIKAAFDSGGLSLSDYVNALREEIKFLEGKRDAPGGELTAEEVKALQKAQKDITDAFTKDILNRQERDIEVAKLLGAEESDIDLKTVQNNLDNLGNVNFKDPEERRKAALAVLASTRSYYENILENTNDLALAQKLLADGFEIPAAVREALFKSDIESGSIYQTIAKFVQNLRISGRDDPQMAALLTRYGIDKDKGPGRQLQDFLDEYFSTEGVSAETISNYQKQYNGLQNELATNKGLTDPQKANIQGQIDFLAGLLGFVGKLPTKDISQDKATGSADSLERRATSGNDPTSTLFGEDPVALKAAFDKAEKKKAADREAKIEDGIFNYRKAVANGNAIEIAAINKQQAQAQLARAKADDTLEGQAAQWEAMAAIVQADQEMVNAIKAVNDAKFGLAQAVAEDAGDSIGAANIEVQKAQADLALAKSTGDAAGVASAQAAIIQARKGVRDAIAAQRDAQAEYSKAVLSQDDPIKQAQSDLNLAKIQEQEARGATEKANAALKVLEAERALRDAMSESRQAIFNLREAQLKSLDDDVGAANVAAQAARAQLADAVARGAGSAEIANLQAGVINADKQARDTLLQTKLDDYKYLLDTGKITKSQYIKYLEQVQQTLAPGSKAFKDLELTLRQLKNDIGQDLQANLPTSFDLPTLYEVRRLNQTGTQGGAPAGQSIGYQDNRQVDVQITIGQNMSAEQITTVLADALGTGRNGSGARRY